MTRAKAIEQMCRNCIEDPCQSVSWRKQTHSCVSVTCPLYQYRPKSRADEETILKQVAEMRVC